MAGISTLGLGSSGVLNNDLLDQLRKVDTDAKIKPIERSQEDIKLKQTGLKSIKDIMNQLSDLATTLSDPSHYQATKFETFGDSVSINVDSNVAEQSMKIDVKQLAKTSIKESKGYASKDDPIGEGNLHLEIDGNSYDIEITDEDSLETLSKKIEEQTDGKIKAYVLNAGGDEPYHIMLKSSQTGKKNDISATGGMNFKTKQYAKDAEFKIDNATVTSSSNKIEDVIKGIDITLQKTGESTIDIKQDTEKITKEMDEFVSKYNEALKLITDLTNYDADKKVGAVFQGSSEIKSIKSQLRDIFETTFSSDGKMMEDFGLKADKKGIITFDKDQFQTTLKDSPTQLTNFFVGEGGDSGIFRKFSSTLFDITTSSSGPLKSLKENYDDKAKTLQESLERAKKSLDNKYEIMQKKFASYDAVIGRLKNSSDYLTNLIESQYKK